MQKISRRGLLALVGSTVAASKVSEALAQDGGDDMSIEQIHEIFANESEEPTPTGIREIIRNYWFEQPEGERLSANWPQDNISFDYAHLTGEPNVNEPFELKAETVQKLFELNSFSVAPNMTRVLFALRGCMLSGGAEWVSSATSHQVSVTRPDHVHQKCVFGVLDVKEGKIALFRGSTVPNIDFMEKYDAGELACNMMPTGFHYYRVGPHKGKRMPGAFRQQHSLWVLRAKGDTKLPRKNRVLSYSSNADTVLWDDLDGNLPFDNIHWTFFSPKRTKPPFYSSAGCQVVSAWGEFRKAAGLVHPPIVLDDSGRTSDDGKEFYLALLTGKDARLVNTNAPDVVRSIRYGSSGQAVRSLQEKLSKLNVGFNPKDIDSEFGRKTMRALIVWQKANRFAQTGILSGVQSRTLGIKLS
jgi:endonuclease G